MPTVLRKGPYRFFFFSHEPNEPPHIHVDRDDLSAKFWIEKIQLARNIGFSPNELSKIYDIVLENRNDLLEAWNEFFGAGNR